MTTAPAPTIESAGILQYKCERVFVDFVLRSRDQGVGCISIPPRLKDWHIFSPV